MIWLLLVGIAVLLLYFHGFKPMRYWKDRGVKQSSPVPFFGDNLGTILGMENLTGLVQRLYNLYPTDRYVGVYQNSKPTLMLRDPELIKQVGIKDFDHFTDHRNVLDPEVDPLGSESLFFLKGQKWRDMRATLTGTFTSSKMKHIFGLMKEASDNFVQYFLKKEEKIIEVEMKNIFTRYTNDIIATTAFGVQVDSLKDQQNGFYLKGIEATDLSGLWKNLKVFVLLIFPKIAKFLNISFFSQEVCHFFNNLINDTIKIREEKGIVRPDMINLLMAAKKGNQKISSEENGVIDTGFAVAQESEIVKKATKKIITNSDIASQALLFFFAGFETVSSLMCFLAYEMAVNQDIQRKLRREIEKTVEECKGNVTYEELLKMKYLDMVVTETLRKWPPIAAMDRVCTKAYTIEAKSPGEKSVKLSVGDVVWLPCYGIHRDPAIYSNPDTFDPERFSDENKGSVNPYTYLPFGVGPRNCIASRFALLESKVVFFNLLANFEIVPTARSQIPIKISKKSFNVMAENGFWFGLKRV